MPQVAAAAGLSYQPLAALLDGSGTRLDPDAPAVLLAAMQEASRAPKPAVLGAVGKARSSTGRGTMVRPRAPFLAYHT